MVIDMNATIFKKGMIDACGRFYELVVADSFNIGKETNAAAQILGDIFDISVEGLVEFVVEAVRFPIEDTKPGEMIHNQIIELILEREGQY